MIEVSAKLTRGNVFLSGEIVECSISFNHPISRTHMVSQSHTDILESLAWASAQIQCQCFTDSKLHKEPEKVTQQSPFAAATALGANELDNNGRVEFVTKPKILFCDLRLSPGQTKTYIYREKLLSESLPSYRGQIVKYSYKIIIGTQRVNSPVKLLRLPIRVLPLFEATLTDASLLLCNDTTEELTPTNPFMDIKQKDTLLDVALQSLQNITARRNPNFYMITNMWGKVCRFCLFKPAYKLGEDIIGTFDFTVSTVKCVQVSVSLQCEEETNLGNNSSGKQVRIVTVSKFHEVCLGYDYSELILPIPLHVTPSFSTKLVTLKWRLHFEFVTSTNKSLEMPGLGSTDWQAPGDVSIETMVWNLPIQLFATTPIHVAQAIQANTVYKLSIR